MTSPTMTRGSGSRGPTSAALPDRHDRGSPELNGDITTQDEASWIGVEMSFGGADPRNDIVLCWSGRRRQTRPRSVFHVRDLSGIRGGSRRRRTSAERGVADRSRIQPRQMVRLDECRPTPRAHADTDVRGWNADQSRGVRRQSRGKILDARNTKTLSRFKTGPTSPSPSPGAATAVCDRYRTNIRGGLCTHAEARIRDVVEETGLRLSARAHRPGRVEVHWDLVREIRWEFAFRCLRLPRAGMGI
jgi:hypothetical protein